MQKSACIAGISQERDLGSQQDSKVFPPDAADWRDTCMYTRTITLSLSHTTEDGEI